MTEVFIKKVFINNNKQIGYEVEDKNRKIMTVNRSNLGKLLSSGYKLTNATISKSGVVRVASSIPREESHRVEDDIHSIEQCYTLTGYFINKANQVMGYEVFVENAYI